MKCDDCVFCIPEDETNTTGTCTLHPPIPVMVGIVEKHLFNKGDQTVVTEWLQPPLPKSRQCGDGRK